jgi:hypothetical protein
MKTKIFTKTVANFLTDSEIKEIENIMQTTNFMSNASGAEHGHHQADYHYIDLYNDGKHLRISEILLPKLTKLFHPKLYIDDCHIMESFEPYTPHTDTLTPVPRDGYTYGWTFIIPLDDYNSNTFMFEEECTWTKNVQIWAQKENILPKDTISDDLYQRYFTHADRNDFRYLTFHDMFPWRKGWLSATSRARFHSSDDYKAKGHLLKRAIVMWTSLPDSV